jgi:hypothetical protein
MYQSQNFVSLGSLLDPLIERLQNARVHCGNHVDRGVQLFFGHARFPCIRKAPIHSRIAEPHHRNRETDEHLLALAETLHGVRVAVESSKVGFLHVIALSNRGRRMLRPYTRNQDQYSRAALLLAALTIL